MASQGQALEKTNHAKQKNEIFEKAKKNKKQILH